MKKVIIVLCGFVLCLSIAAQQVVAKGSCGSNVTWEFNSRGVLTISGNGPMNDFTTSPWYEYHEDIKEAVVSRGVTSVGTNCFEDCYNLESVALGSSVKSIGWYAFSHCYNLESVAVPNMATSIGGYAFSNCRSLSSFIINSFIEEVGAHAFWGCHMAKNKFKNMSKCSDASNWDADICDEETSEGLLITGDEAVYCRPKATSVTIPETVKSIKQLCFYECASLSEVNTGNGVETLGDCCFEGCTALNTVTLGSAVKTINGEAFSRDIYIQDVYCYATVPPTCVREDVFYGDTYGYATLHIPMGEGVRDSYKAALGWRLFRNVEDIVPAGIDAQFTTLDTPTSPAYNLQGQRLRKPVRGVNVVGGHKVIR